MIISFDYLSLPIAHPMQTVEIFKSHRKHFSSIQTFQVKVTIFDRRFLLTARSKKIVEISTVKVTLTIRLPNILKEAKADLSPM